MINKTKITDILNQKRIIPPDKAKSISGNKLNIYKTHTKQYESLDPKKTKEGGTLTIKINVFLILRKNLSIIHLSPIINQMSVPFSSSYP